MWAKSAKQSGQHGLLKSIDLWKQFDSSSKIKISRKINLQCRSCAMAKLKMKKHSKW